MSYILDALRRADSERDRGAVPDLFAQPLPRVSVDASSASGPGRWLWAALAALALALVGMVTWRLMAPAVPVALAPVTAAATTPEEAAPAPAAVAPPALPPQTASTTPPPTPPTPVPMTAPQARVAEPARPVRKPVRGDALTADKPAAASTAESRIYAQNELPSEVQRELPTLAIGGASYSESPANRMLIINGQVFHEGDKLAPDLVLEQIKLKDAVLRYKTYRYGVSY